MARKSQPLSALLAKEKPEVLQAAQHQAEGMLLDLCLQKQKRQSAAFVWTEQRREG